MIKFILVVAVYNTFGGNPIIKHTEIYADEANCVAAGKAEVQAAKEKYPDADYTCYRRKVKSGN